MKKLSSYGFSLPEVLLALILVVLVAFVGYYVYHSNQVATKTYNTASNVAQTNPLKNNKPATKTKSEIGATTNSSTSAANVLTIKEWGVNVEFSDASKVTYTLNSDATTAALALKSSVTDVAACQLLGVSINRAKATTVDSKDKFQVAGYEYSISGAPGSCSGASDAVNQLRATIAGQELGSAVFVAE